MPTIGTPDTCASVFAVSTPTRRPVNSPGPMPTAMPPTCASVRSLRRSSSCSNGRHRFLPRRAGHARPGQDLVLGADRDRRLRCRRVDADDDHAGTVHGITAASSSANRSIHPAPVAEIAIVRTSSPSVRGRDLHAQPALGQQLLDRVAPLHEQHVVAAAELLQAEIDDVLDAVEAVHVDVCQVEDARVLLHERERRRHHGLLDAQPACDALGERRLARAQLPGEHHGVAGAQQRGDRLADLAGLLGRRGADLDAHLRTTPSGRGRAPRPRVRRRAAR